MSQASATEAPKWKFNTSTNIPEFTILVNREDETISIYTPCYQETYFILTQEPDLYTYYSLEDWDKINSNKLMETEPGIYEGTVDTKGINSLTVSFRRGVSGMSGINIPYVNKIDFSGADIKEVDAWNSVYYDEFLFYTPINVTNSKRFIDVTYDSNINKLTFRTCDESGIEDLVSDSVVDNLTVIPGVGNVRILASEDSYVEIYSLAGIRVRTLNVSAGETVVDLPSGFYVVGRSKVLVR